MSITRSVYQRIHRWLKPVGAGAWLFKQPRLAWMYEADLNGQLPPLIRLLAAYYELMGRLPEGSKVPFGDRAFSLASALTRRLTSTDSLELEVEGFSIHLDLIDPRCLYVVNELRLAHPVGACLNRLLAPGDTFIDVGANHGSFSLVAGRVIGAGGRLIAIEPNPKLAKLVALSLARSCPCRFEVLEIACGDEDGDVDLFVPLGSSGAAGRFRSFSAKGRHRRMTVEQQRLDQALNGRYLPGRVVLKLDAEGSEYAALRGAVELIHCRAPTLLLEFNPDSLRAAGLELRDLIELLLGLGYESFCTLDEAARDRPLAELGAHPHENVLLRHSSRTSEVSGLSHDRSRHPEQPCSGHLRHD